jgi:hypothetical protein
VFQNNLVFVKVVNCELRINNIIYISVQPLPSLITRLYVPTALKVKLDEFWNALPFTLYVAGKIVAEETVDKSIVNGYHHNK